jgi:hypothetical protein
LRTWNFYEFFGFCGGKFLSAAPNYDIIFPSEKTDELSSVGGNIKCGNIELQHVCMADRFMSFDHRARLDGAIEFVCKDLLSGKCVTYFQSLSSRYGNYSESVLRKLRKDQWANQSDEYKLEWREDKKRRWDDRSDQYKLEWSEDWKKWWADQSDEYKLEWREDQKKWWANQAAKYNLKWWVDLSEEYKLEWRENKKKWWDNQSDEYKQEWSEDQKKRRHDLRKLSSRSTEEAAYYAIDGANEDGTYILITEIFGTNDLNFTKKVRRRNGKKMETIDELHLRKCSTKTCTNKKMRSYTNCNSCLGYWKEWWESSYQ